MKRRSYKRKSPNSKFRHQVTYRSGLEKANQDHLKAKGVEYGYESMKIPFLEPAKNRNYTPDFFLPNGIIIETNFPINHP